MRVVVLLGILLLSVTSQAATLSHGRFKDVRIYQPEGQAKQVVLLLSGREGWSDELTALAQGLARDGTFVAGIDTPSLLADFERDDASCVYPDGDLENLSHFLQAYFHLPGYRPAVLAGIGSGAAFAYAVLAQAPADAFAGGIALEFCPELMLKKPLCKIVSRTTRSGDGAVALPIIKAEAPWFATASSQCFNRSLRDARSGADGLKQQGADAQDLSRFVSEAKGEMLPQGPRATQLAAAMRKIEAQGAAGPLPSPVELNDLPIIEVQAKGAGDQLAVLITGDGGWAGLDKQLAAALAKQGIAVVGLDSLRYFWKARTPGSTASDVDRILRYYLAAWKKQRVLLIGYSQGADVLPFVVNALPPATRSRIRLAALLAPGRRAVFEFHLSNWLRTDDAGLPLQPEMTKLTGTPVICVYGADEDDSLCPTLAPARARVIKLPGGHHFDGDYERLAKLILR